MRNVGPSGFNRNRQMGTQRQPLLSGGGRLSSQSGHRPGSGMMSPYSQDVAISSADSVLSHRSLGPSNRPLQNVAGQSPMDQPQGSFSQVQDMAMGGHNMQGTPPNPWNQPEVRETGFIHSNSQGPLVASPIGGALLDTVQASGSSLPLNKMVMPSVVPTVAAQPRLTEPLVPANMGQPRGPLSQRPLSKQWPSEAPLVKNTPGDQGTVWTQGTNQPLATMPQSIMIGSEPTTSLLASSKPGYQPVAPIVSVKQKPFVNKNKDAPADVNTGSNTFAGEQAPLGKQFNNPPDVQMMKNNKNVMADYSIVKETGPLGPLLPGSPAPPTDPRQLYKATPILNVRQQTNPQFTVSMPPTDMAYQTSDPILTGAPSTHYVTDAWTTVPTTAPPVITTTPTQPPTTTTTLPTTTNVYTRLSAIIAQEKLKKEKEKELTALRVALKAIGISNSSGLYQRLETLSAAARKSILKRASDIQKQKKSRTRPNRRTG